MNRTLISGTLRINNAMTRPPAVPVSVATAQAGVTPRQLPPPIT
jgi:hypothetical protein